MDKTKVKLSLIKYKIKTFQLIVGTKKINITPEEIIKFTIVNDYENYYFPYFEIELNVSNTVYRTMAKNPTKIKASINLYKVKMKDTYHISDDSTNTNKKCLSGIFRVFLDDSTPDFSETEEKEISKKGDKYGQITTLKLLLYPNLYYGKYDLVVNGVFKNVSLADMVCYILTKTKINKVLLSPPSNYKKYSQFILPPLPTNEQISRLCGTYALHSKGSMVYFDLDRAYIIDKVPRCTAYAKNEYKISYVFFFTEAKGAVSTGGCGSITKSKVNILNATNIAINNNREIVKKSVGKNIVSIDSGGKITKSNGKSSKVTRVVVNDEGNSTVKSIKNNIKESKNMITANFVDVDINMITPNKQFIMSIDGAKYKKYNGKYRLTKAVHSFSKDGDYFQVSTICEFRG